MKVLDSFYLTQRLLLIFTFTGKRPERPEVNKEEAIV